MPTQGTLKLNNLIKVNYILPNTVKEYWVINIFVNEISKVLCLDCDSKGGEIMLHVREDIPSNLIAFEDKPIESLFTKYKNTNTLFLQPS